MSSFSFWLLSIQACLIQQVFSQFYYGPSYSGSSVDINVDIDTFASASGYGLGGAYGRGGAYGLGAVDVYGLGGAYGLADVDVYGLGGGYGFGVADIGVGPVISASPVNVGYTGANIIGVVPDVAAVATLPVTGPYGGTGYGELAVGGTIGASGTAVVTGQLPVLGAVSINGKIPASGVVSIAGNCGCSGVLL